MVVSQGPPTAVACPWMDALKDNVIFFNKRESSQQRNKTLPNYTSITTIATGIGRSLGWVVVDTWGCKGAWFVLADAWGGDGVCWHPGLVSAHVWDPH